MTISDSATLRTAISLLAVASIGLGFGLSGCSKPAPERSTNEPTDGAEKKVPGAQAAKHEPATCSEKDNPPSVALPGFQSYLGMLKCEVPYALCYYAKCKAIPGTAKAECGCAGFPDGGTSFVYLEAVKDAAAKKLTFEKCPAGLASCDGDSPETTAPICKQIAEHALYPEQKPDLISTFSTGTPKFEYHGVKRCGLGLYADCMTAPCFIRKAWDGSPVTCECSVLCGEYTIAQATPSPSCELTEGNLWSGAPD